MTKRPYIPSISEQPYTTLPSASVRVLLIEDDASYAGLVKILLNANSEQHCEVVVAGTLQGGLQLLSERSDFDAVLLDLNLPDSAGLTTLHTLLHDFPATNVIVLTGSANAAQGLQAVGDGAQDYLVKGEFEPSQLSRILRFSMERRQILTRLEEAQAMAHVGNWEIRPDQDYCYISKEIFRILEVETEGQGLTYDELCASPFSQLHYLLAHEKTAAGQVDFQQELTWEARDGSQRYAQLSSRKTINRYGQTTYQGTLQDQTIQKRAQELQRAQEIAQETARVREQVIANVSHELRTPMNAILGMSDLLADTKLANEQRDYLDSIQDASQLLLGIINDILLTSSLQNGSVEISTAVFDLPLAVRRVVEMLQPKARAKGLYLNFNIAANIPTFVEGDKLRLSQILYNIVGNAIKFT
ncbi:MAG: histidine kinase dimerization/phospho-acceptor domain-containing protein, partial [Bacteroidota bacterium]